MFQIHRRFKTIEHVCMNYEKIK